MSVLENTIKDCDGKSNVYSLRIVVADFYLTKPIYNLDPVYSEFRGHEIKTIPVIRIFGPNKNGEKVCMHVHGVLPYFYVPYESTNLGKVDQVIYQIAASIDKALNISFGQANSQTKHVFKVQLVKGIPLYGYHRKEHQFFKIFLFNPRHFKRVTKLLQNGAILGKIFQPYEAHIPFVLQFLIDYNLYGMGYLNVPEDCLKYRKELATDVNEEMPVNCLKRMSISKYEVDIRASSILNRFEILNKSTTNTNPGIESIWEDERIRRQKLVNVIDAHENLSLAPSPSQERLNVKSIESEILYKNALKCRIDKLISLINESSNQTINLTNIDESTAKEKSTFNLKQLLMNSVYPEECSQKLQTTLANASLIENHLSDECNAIDAQREFIPALSVRNGNKEEENESRKNDNYRDNDVSVIDEQLIVNLTQTNSSQYKNQTLTTEDYELLKVLKELEEDENEDVVDLDSTLAPITPQSPTRLNKLMKKTLETSVIGNLNNFEYGESGEGEEEQIRLHMSDTDSDDEEDVKYSNCTPASENIDDILLQICDSKLQIPQFDGIADKPTPKTPTKRNSRSRKSSSLAASSPKSQKSLRYAPLEISTQRTPMPDVSAKKKLFLDNGNDDDIISISSTDSTQIVSPSVTQRPNKLMSPRRKTLLMNITKNDNNLKKKLEHVKQKRNRNKNNSDHNNSLTEKSLLTCNLRPQRCVTSKCHLPKNMYKIKNKKQTPKSSHHIRKCHVKVKKLKRSLVMSMIEKMKAQNPKAKQERTNSSQSDKIELTAVTQSQSQQQFDKIRHSPCDIAREYDRKNNFFPEPGPSHVNYYELIEVPNPAVPNTRSETPKNFQNHLNRTTDGGEDNDILVQSFYDKSDFIDSPSIFSDLSLSNPICSGDGMLNSLSSKSKRTNNCENVNEMKITLEELPPKYDDCLGNLSQYKIPDVTHMQPFYSRNHDVTTYKEIGHKTLHIPGKSLNNLPQFNSQISSLCGLNVQRKKLLDEFQVTNCDFDSNEFKLRESFCNQENCEISTRDLPPKFDWLTNKFVKTSGVLNGVDVNDAADDCGDEKLCMQSDLTPSKFAINGNLENKKHSCNNVGLTPLSRYKKLMQLKNNSKSSRLSLSGRGKSSQTPTNIMKLIETEEEYKLKSVPVVKLKRLDRKRIKVLKCSGENDVNQPPQETFNKNSPNNISKLEISMKSTESQDRSFGISGPQLENTFGFKFNLDNLQNAKADVEPNFLTILSLEIFVPTRGDLKPNPKYDQIKCIFYSILENNTIEEFDKRMNTGYIIVKGINFISSHNHKNDDGHEFDAKKNTDDSDGCERITYVEDEKELINELIKLCNRCDPDILTGYEIEMNSWGYVIDRGKYLDMNLLLLLSRVPFHQIKRQRRNDDGQKGGGDALDEDRDQFTDLDVEMKIAGRILLNLWRLMRSEIALMSYTFENCMFHILHRRVPLHSFADLTKWFNSIHTQWICIEYYLERVKGNLQLLNQLDLIDRTSEMAKVIGIQFYEILSRGSQFRVESMMLRMAKPRNFVPLSPTVQQRAHMKAPEYLPLILEPQSKFYADPVIVLDFQSLYPSMVIAYNYCFSTCLGRVEHLGDSDVFEFGASQLKVPLKYLKHFIENDLINISPCGVAFVKHSVREGILSKMLQEILDTRLMVKRSMKLHNKNETLQKVLHSRQLALKLMANVTYGYTAANFSGRMPCVEVADSIVSKGRETLERAIKMVKNNVDRWGAKVIYGDTDSLFVIVPGKSREIAFKIGEEISEAITNDNPKPVKLKLEKVYQPCILQTKKRYVGYMYESADQKNPVYEAKGIETVRRDGCPAVAKILEKSLRVLFETCDVSDVKKYVCRQFTKLLSGQGNIQDLIFAKEFRGLNGYKAGACLPALELTRKWLQTDPRSEPRRGERVPFVIVNGPPNVPLIRLVRSPQEFLSNDGYKINALYYITKAIIPPLNRCLLLIGADVNGWFAELPRKNLSLPLLSTASEIIKSANGNLKKSTISQYFSSKNCAIDCGRHTNYGICEECKLNSQKCVVTLSNKIWQIDRGSNLLKKICESCCGRCHDIECYSFDCPVLFVLNAKQKDCRQIEYYKKLLDTF